MKFVTSGLSIILVLTAAGCSAVNDAADTIARDRAKDVVNTVVQRNLPGVKVAPVTDCIIDAASAGEILTIAGDSVTGVSPATVDLVLKIAQRPDSVECIASNSITLLGG